MDLDLGVVGPVERLGDPAGTPIWRDFDRGAPCRAGQDRILDFPQVFTHPTAGTSLPAPGASDFRMAKNTASATATPTTQVKKTTPMRTQNV